MHGRYVVAEWTPLGRVVFQRQWQNACPAFSRALQHTFAFTPCPPSRLGPNVQARWKSDVPDKERDRNGHAPSRHESANARPAADLSQSVTEEERSHYKRLEEHSKEAQRRSPWTRDGSDTAPVHKPRSASAMVKGKLLTTPSRMLKLILPLTPLDTNSDKKDVEPLALFVHPQQPLSYLERLIQSELPPVQDKHGNDKTPSVVFRAADASAEENGESEEKDDQSEYMRIDGRMQKTGRLNSPGSEIKSSKKESSDPPQDPNEPHPDYEDERFIRWSPSTEIGDFIRDASHTHVFLVSIEGSPFPIPVAVPSFADRTFYLRMRLRKLGGRIADMSTVKNECDQLAHRGAKRVAQAGFCGLIGWWYLVYRLTFETDLGWDVMEPVTYLVGLSGLIGGYTWFLYHNREVSYRSAMKLTVSKRQQKLYDARGFDLPRWESLVEEANRLRREIKLVADEYDVEWDEAHEAGEDVSEALRKERRKDKKNGGKTKKKKDDEDEEDDEDD